MGSQKRKRTNQNQEKLTKHEIFFFTTKLGVSDAENSFEQEREHKLDEGAY